MTLFQEHEYAVDIREGSSSRPIRRGLSHVQAMACAEQLQRAGQVARVMHVVGDASYEVDRYPPR